MKNSLLNRFVPKETKFFPLLQQLSHTVQDASRLLIDSMEYDTPDTWLEFYREIKEAEKEGDRITQLIFKELGQTFITRSTGRTYTTWLLPLMMWPTVFTAPPSESPFIIHTDSPKVLKNWLSSYSKALPSSVEPWTNWNISGKTPHA